MWMHMKIQQQIPQADTHIRGLPGPREIRERKLQLLRSTKDFLPSNKTRFCKFKSHSGQFRQGFISIAQKEETCLPGRTSRRSATSCQSSCRTQPSSSTQAVGEPGLRSLPAPPPRRTRRERGGPASGRWARLQRGPPLPAGAPESGDVSSRMALHWAPARMFA
ncbi:hypothetical protein CB1_001771002 [Camelus ferus]|nr:hypothetical protein CB1_001771002 [Camelus ferus]